MSHFADHKAAFTRPKLESVGDLPQIAASDLTAIADRAGLALVALDEGGCVTYASGAFLAAADHRLDAPVLGLPFAGLFTDLPGPELSGHTGTPGLPLSWSPLLDRGWLGILTAGAAAKAADPFLDELTGLGNRSALRCITGQKKATAQSNPITLIYLDLDRFKIVNDTLGHPAGDILLTKVAERLRRAVRQGDTVIRMGGDEFAVVLDDVPSQNLVEEIAERIINLVSRPFLVDGNQVHVGVSIGLAKSRTDEPEIAEALRRADIALYASKNGGRGQYQWYHPSMAEAINLRRQTEDGLRRAIHLDELELHFQPQIVFSDNSIRAFEALVRWRHPELGLLPPKAFISIAEETGIIFDLGKWVLRAACRAATGWPDHIKVSVNVSTVQFQSKDLVPTVLGILDETGLPARRLELEITETVLMDGESTMIERMETLKEHGVSLALDDFGTGYSSINYLRSLPFDQIKIDQSYVSQTNRTAMDLAVLDSITRLGSAFGIQVVAEGVETSQQLADVVGGGAQSVQGYLVTEPLGESEVASFIKRQTSSKTKGAKTSDRTG